MIDKVGQNCRAKANLLVREEEEAIMAEIATRRRRSEKRYWSDDTNNCQSEVNNSTLLRIRLFLVNQEHNKQR